MKNRIHLPLKNMLRRPGRTSALVILSAFLCFSVLGGSMIITGLRSGLSSLRARLGADVMVVPYEASTKSKLSDIVLHGNPGYFYMNRSVTEEIRQIEGVEKVSEQFFLASASSSCCSLAVQLIGFDPETDFTIQPWIEHTYKGKLGEMEILVGSSLNAFAGDTLTFYGTDCKVAARLEKTGTYLDTSVYASEETIKTLIRAAKEKQLFDFGDVDPDQIVSSVLVDVREDIPVDDVLNDIKLHVRKTEAVRPGNMISDVALQLTGVSDTVGGMIGVIWVLCLAIEILAYIMISNERKKEYAVLRALGASGGFVARSVLAEALAAGAAGGLCGAVLAAVVTSAFGNLIEQSLGLPFLLPDLPHTLLLALIAILATAAAGAAAAAISAAKAAKTDAALLIRVEN